MKKAVIAWGRMNPVTSGHEKLVKKVQDVARRERVNPRIYLSHTQNAKKDPLQYKDKIAMARKAFGPVVRVSQSRTLIQLMQELQKAGYKQLVMVAGSDRVNEYDTLLNKYNGKEYEFESIKVVSAGERDPDAEGASGMSATKLRQAAANGDEATFMKGVPSKMSTADAKKLYTLVRKGLLVEEMEMFLEKNKDIAKMTDKDVSDKELQKYIDELELEELDEEIDRDVEMMFEEDALLERAPLTLQQRIKKARIMKRLAPRLKRQRQIKKFRMAPTERLVMRAKKAARNILRKKFAGEKGANYVNLPPATKISVDRMIATKGAMIDRIAKRLLPMIRKKEVERIRQARKGSKNESFETIDQILEAKMGPNRKAAEVAIEREKQADRNEKERDKIRHDRMRDRARTLDTIRKNKASNPYSGREEVELTKSEQALFIKANKNGLDFDAVLEVYTRGVEAWNNNPRKTVTAEQWGFARVNTFIAEVKAGNVIKDADVLDEGKKPGLWDNIHAKRKRIKAGSGEKMRKPGSKGAPTAQDFKNAAEEVQETKAAPKGFHFTKDGKLKRGDADQDGPGGKMLRADPLDKQRSKVPPVSENFQDGKNPQDKGDAARHGLKGKTKAQLKKIRSSDSASPRKKQLAHWMLNMHHNEEAQINEGFVAPTAQQLGIKMKGGFAHHPTVEEEHGAGEEGTDELTKKYKKETPGQ